MPETVAFLDEILCAHLVGCLVLEVLGLGSKGRGAYKGMQVQVF